SVERLAQGVHEEHHLANGCPARRLVVAIGDRIARPSVGLNVLHGVMQHVANHDSLLSSCRWGLATPPPRPAPARCRPRPPRGLAAPRPAARAGSAGGGPG